MTNELIKFEDIKLVEVFSTEKGLDPIIEKIREEVKSETFDVTTEKGRARMKSVAHKIGSSKQKLLSMSKELTEDWRKKTKAVTLETSRMEKEMDALRDETKAPAVAFENKEKVRVQAHEEALEKLTKFRSFVLSDEHGNPTTVSLLEVMIKTSKDFYSNRDWEEFSDKATFQQESINTALNTALDARKKHEAEQVELEQLRKEEEERKVQAELDRVAEEAANKARVEAENKATEERLEAERKAKAEQERVENEKLAAENRAKEAEQAKIDVENKAKADAEEAESKIVLAKEEAEREKQEAILLERKKIEDQTRLEAAEREKRESDLKHRKKINNEALQAIIKFEAILDAEERGKSIVQAIAEGKIPNVTINY